MHSVMLERRHVQLHFCCYCTTKRCLHMFPHSLSVVVTSFTKGISAAITSSSSLGSGAWKIQQKNVIWRRMEVFKCTHPLFSMRTSLRWTKLAGNNPWRDIFKRKMYFSGSSPKIQTSFKMHYFFGGYFSITNEQCDFIPAWLYFWPSSLYTILKYKPSIT